MNGILFFTLLCAAAAGDAPVNTALGAGCTFTPTPAYQYCTDAEDARQLTDGVYTQGHFWTQPTTVGWSGVCPVTITLDLGEPKPISGVSYSTAAGVAGVRWPEAVYLFVSDEQQQYYEAGELVALSEAQSTPPEDGYAQHRFVTHALHARGRYFTLVVYGSPFIFADEIEVYGGSTEWLAEARAGEPIVSLEQHMKDMTTHEGVARRLRRDIRHIREALDADGLSPENRAGVAALLDAAEAGMPGLPIRYGPAFRNILPLNPLHAQVFQAQARRWRLRGLPALTLWTTPAWDALDLLADPPATESTPLAVVMMQNEYRSAAFNLTNATETDLAAEVVISGLPGGDNPDWIAVDEVLWTDTSNGVPIASALQPCARENGAHRVSVPAGMTRQVWLTFHSRDIAPGAYAGRVAVRGAGLELALPLEVSVAALRFPDKPALHLGGWDYMNVEKGMYGITPETRDAFIATLRAHFVDSPWATPSTMTHGTYDDTGAMTAPPDTANFDTWVGRWPGAGQYCVFASVSATLGKWAAGVPEFDRAVGEWARFWAAHVQEKGIAPEQVAVLLVDEPREKAQSDTILAWAKALHAAGTGIRVWEDPIYLDMAEADPAMLAECDVLCPNRPMFLAAEQPYRDVYLAARDRGTTLELYSCSGSVHGFDPYRYYRLQGWDCWRFGATASYFWAFGDNAGFSSWNEYATPRAMYTPLFIDAEGVTEAKHMEAVREGVEDYEYLRMLDAAIDGAAARGVDAAVVDKARAVLAEWPGRVCEAKSAVDFRWVGNDMDHTRADQARAAILEALAALGG